MKSTESKLIMSELVDLLPGYIYWKDRAGVYLGCNQEYAHVLGLNTTRDIVGKDDYDLFKVEQAEKLRRIDQFVIDTQKSYVMEETFLLAEGRQITLLSKKNPVLNESGSAIGTITTSIDITAQKEKEGTLNQLKAELIADIGHDIRTPLTGMLGLAESLINTSETDENRHDAKLLKQSTEELLKILNEMIDVLYLESPMLASKDESFKIDDVITHNKNLLEPAAHHKKLVLNYLTPKNSLFYIYGKKSYLERILLNIVSNSIKFTEKGSIDILVEFEKISNVEIKLIIQVKDTGIGIPQERIKDIFDRYSRIPSSYSGASQGSGIGLYVVKKYLDEMDGEISVLSQLGKGSCFTIKIPFKIIEKILENEKIPSPIFKESAVNILIVEDNILAARTTQQVLDKLGCVSDIVTTGQAALIAVKQKKYDLLLMDINLPDQSGLHIARQINSLFNLKAMPIIALSGYISPEKKEACQNSGMRDLITKPITVKAAESLLKKWIIQNNAIEELLTVSMDEGIELAGNSECHAHEMIALLIESLPKQLNDVESAYATKNFEKLTYDIHKIYGGLCYVGVPKLREITRQLNEELQGERNVDNMQWLVSKFCNEVKMLLDIYKFA